MKLEIQTSDQRITLEHFPVTIGRGEHVTLRLDDCYVSRQHCEVDWADGSYVIRDLSAKHGTYVNGERISERPLLEGDEVDVGLTRMLVLEMERQDSLP